MTSHKLIRNYVVLASGFALLFSGCAGTFFSKIDHKGDLPKDMPTEYYKKFEVKDATQVMAPDPAFVGPPSPNPSTAASAEVAESERPHRGRRWMRSQEQQEKDLALAQIGPKKHVPLVYRTVTPVGEKNPIWIGEKLTYDVSYLGLTAATFILEALPYKYIAGRKVYEIQATVHSSSAFSLFYKLEDVVQTFIDTQGVFSHRFHMQLNESKQIRDSLELFDSESEEAFWWNRWDRKEKGYEEKKEFHPMEPFPQDSLSSLYYLRFVPLPQDAAVKFVVESEAKPLDAVITVVGRETLETPVGRLKTIKVKPEAATRGVLERKGNSYIWLSDDDRRFLVRLEAQVKIGTIVVRLKKIEKGTPPGQEAASPVENLKQ
jgi:hypothetical protein